MTSHRWRPLHPIADSMRRHGSRSSLALTDTRKLLLTRGIRGVADGVVSLALATYLTGVR
jgi:hypothetical protein